MPQITFGYRSTHQIVLRNTGVTAAVPALPAQGRLYVIYNASTDRHVYIGTAANVQARFTSRIDACRELGFNQVQIEPIQIFVVQILIDDVSCPPGDNGISHINNRINDIGIDVEQLLIRFYITHHFLVRNIQKTNEFINRAGLIINWQLINSAGIQNFGGPWGGVIQPNGRF